MKFEDSDFKNYIKQNEKNQAIYVTRPYLPPLSEFLPYLEKIWDSGILTNSGTFHEEFENELTQFLEIKYISLFVNGTAALMVALKALDIDGEVITTPFSFVATSHVLSWNKIEPVFVDIEPEYLTLDPDKIKSVLTKKTKAILPVHVFGHPCKHNQISQIAEENNLKVIYDACHSFGVKFQGKSILNFGDLSVLSFHATKAFNTFEGGAIISSSEKMKAKIDKLKNYGFVNEVSIEGIGINGKMNEFQAALGLLQLKYFEKQIAKRINIAECYKAGLKEIPGISCIPVMKGLENTYPFFPVLVDEEKYGNSRDYIYSELKKKNIFTRRYFYPLISDLPTYRKLPSAAKNNLQVADRISKQVLCLPIYSDLDTEIVLNIIEIIKRISV